LIETQNQGCDIFVRKLGFISISSSFNFSQEENPFQKISFMRKAIQ
jgi:hypothetical protein